MVVHLVFDLLYIDKQVWFFCWVFRGLLRSFIIFGSLTVSWYSGNTYTWFHIWSHSVVCYIIFTYTFNYETLRYTFKLFSLDYYITLETWRMFVDDCAWLMWCKLSWLFVSFHYSLDEANLAWFPQGLCSLTHASWLGPRVNIPYPLYDMPRLLC